MGVAGLGFSHEVHVRPPPRVPPASRPWQVGGPSGDSSPCCPLNGAPLHPTQAYLRNSSYRYFRKVYEVENLVMKSRETD